jgi:hypothetical protein
MKRPFRRRKANSLSPLVNRGLDMYSVAATAAGVGLLSFGQPCDAEIVYTPAHVIIGYSGTHSVYIDFNHDGANDLEIATFHNGCTTECTANLDVFPFANEIVGRKVAFYSAGALHSGVKIGSQDPLIQCRGDLESCNMLNIFSLYYRKVTGAWNNVKNRYLGVKFSISGETHFGWVRLSAVNRKNEIAALLTGYAYETVPGKEIVAGQTKEPEEASYTPTEGVPVAPQPKPSTLGLLAMGAPGLSIWRREECVDASLA